MFWTSKAVSSRIVFQQLPSSRLNMTDSAGSSVCKNHMTDPCHFVVVSLQKPYHRCISLCSQSAKTVSQMNVTLSTKIICTLTKSSTDTCQCQLRASQANPHLNRTCSGHTPFSSWLQVHISFTQAQSVVKTSLHITQTQVLDTTMSLALLLLQLTW